MQIESSCRLCRGDLQVGKTVALEAPSGPRTLMPRLLGFSLASMICGTSLLFGMAAYAFDLTGVWASNASECNSVFVKRGKTVSFTRESDLHGSGFIVENGRIRGKLASCKIKATREDGPMLNMVAACATDIMLSNVQLSVRFVDDNKIVRIFPGLPEMEYSYERCAMK